jgi:hypothetical protein
LPFSDWAAGLDFSSQTPRQKQLFANTNPHVSTAADDHTIDILVPIPTIDAMSLWLPVTVVTRDHDIFRLPRHALSSIWQKQQAHGEASRTARVPTGTPVAGDLPSNPAGYINVPPLPARNLQSTLLSY